MSKKVFKSKSKGSAFEWVVARDLARWLYKDSEALIRMPTSGALATLLPIGRQHLVGDVLQVKGEPEMPFAVEAKHHKDLPLGHLLLERKTSKIYKFWVKICKESSDANKIPMLVFKSNFQDALVVLPSYCELLLNYDDKMFMIKTKEFFVVKLKDLVEETCWIWGGVVLSG